MHIRRRAYPMLWSTPVAELVILPNQNIRCSPSQTTRLPESGPKNPPGCNVLVITPKLVPQHEVFGLAKWGVFVKLIASARNCSPNRSVNWNSREMLRFMLKYPGPRN